MRVRQTGTGPLLIAVHGLGGSGRYWNDLKAHAPGYTLTAPYLAGFGESSHPDAPYDLAFHVASLVELMNVLSPKGQISVVGHSLGGIVAAGLAADQPNRISALALVATPFPGIHKVPSPVHWVNKAPDARSRRLTVNIARAALSPLLIPTALLRGQTVANVRDYGRQSLTARTRTAISLLEDDSTNGLLGRLSQLPANVPTLLLSGVRDRMMDERDTQAWSSLLPRPPEHVVLGGGHQVLLHGGFAKLGEWLVTARGVTR